MPSWPNSESSDDYRLCLAYGSSDESMDEGYVSDKIEDPSYGGIAADSNLRCFVHKEQPEKFVAFEGTNTGRRFLAYPVKENVGANCGFVDWVHPEWPDTLQNEVSALWTKVDEISHARIEEKIDHALLIKTMAAEKEKAEKKCNNLMAEVGRFIEQTAEQVRQETIDKLKKEGDAEEQQFAMSEFARMELEEELDKVAKERNKLTLELQDVMKENRSLKKELGELKVVQKHDSDMLGMIRKQREDEMTEMKEEKKKLEYMLYDMVNANNMMKEKLKKIKDRCDE